jgi:RNA polymerase sigma-70 factor (sigma-E family)
MPVEATADESQPVLGGRLAELYLRHSPAGLRLAYLLTGDPVLAEDLVQDAFVQLVGRLRHLRQPDAFDAYLRRTIVNLTKNHFRRRRVEREYLGREAGSSSPQTREPDVVTSEVMRLALRRLPVRQRTAVVLRFYEDLPEREIAEILRCRPGTARSLITRGVQALRAEMRGERVG